MASPGKPSRRAVTTMGSNDMVVGHMLGTNCQRYNWQTGRCDSIAFGSSPRRGESSDFKPSLSCGRIHLWKRHQEITSRKIRSGAPKGGLMLNSGLSPAAPQGGKIPPQIKPVWCPRAGGSRQTGSPARHSNHPLSRSSQTSVPPDFLVDGQVSGLGTVHPILNLSVFSTWILPLHVVFSSLILCTKSFGDGAMDDGGRLRKEMAASSSCSARRRPWSDGR